MFSWSGQVLLQRFTNELEQRLRRRIIRQAKVVVELGVIGFLGSEDLARWECRHPSTRHRDAAPARWCLGDRRYAGSGMPIAEMIQAFAMNENVLRAFAGFESIYPHGTKYAIETTSKGWRFGKGTYDLRSNRLDPEPK
jgi:hypothetical protein